MTAALDRFVIAKNPDGASSLKYLVRLPLEGGLVLKVRDTWPKTARVYCHPFEGGWPDSAEIVEDVAVLSCRRRGPAIDLVLDRPRLDRSQFVFTEARGRPMIFWQTRTVAKKASPGGRVPRRRALAAGFTVHVDTREKYAFRFVGREVSLDRAAIPAGDYGVRDGTRWLAVVERKSMEDMIGSLANGTLAFQLAALSELPLAAVVVEGRYPTLFDVPRVEQGWLPDVLARLQIRYREVPIVFADSRKFAEEWTYRFLATSVADLDPPAPASTAEEEEA
ncbi:MAG: ERCC4 domain-containing protein [Kofleriaceae bacterium]